MADTDRELARKARSGDLGSISMAVNPEIPNAGTATPGVTHAQDQYAIANIVLTANEAAANTATDQAFFWTDKSLKLISARYLPAAGLTASDVDFATLLIRFNDDAGGALTTLASFTTQTAGSGGSGNWTANQSQGFTVSATPTLTATPAAPKQLHFVTAKTGAGVVVPKGWVELVYQVIGP